LITSSGAPSCLSPGRVRRARGTPSRTDLRRSSTDSQVQQNPGRARHKRPGIASSELQACLPGLGPRCTRRPCCAEQRPTQNVLSLETTWTGRASRVTADLAVLVGGRPRGQAVAARSYVLAFVASPVSSATHGLPDVHRLPDQYGLPRTYAVSATAAQCSTACG